MTITFFCVDVQYSILKNSNSTCINNFYVDVEHLIILHQKYMIFVFVTSWKVCRPQRSSGIKNKRFYNRLSFVLFFNQYLSWGWQFLFKNFPSHSMTKLGDKKNVLSKANKSVPVQKPIRNYYFDDARKALTARCLNFPSMRKKVRTV